MTSKVDRSISLVTRLQAVQEAQDRRDYDATIQEAIDTLGSQAARIAELEGALERLLDDIPAMRAEVVKLLPPRTWSRYLSAREQARAALGKAVKP